MSRVYLHIGAPKTGTTYMQDRLMLNQAQLAEHGVTIPTKNRFIDADLFHFRAALDLLVERMDGSDVPGRLVTVGHRLLVGESAPYADGTSDRAAHQGA